MRDTGWQQTNKQCEAFVTVFGCSETFHRNREPEALVAGGVLYDDAAEMRCTTRQEDVVSGRGRCGLTVRTGLGDTTCQKRAVACALIWAQKSDGSFRGTGGRRDVGVWVCDVCDGGFGVGRIVGVGFAP